MSSKAAGPLPWVGCVVDGVFETLSRDQRFSLVKYVLISPPSSALASLLLLIKTSCAVYHTVMRRVASAALAGTLLITLLSFTHAQSGTRMCYNPDGTDRNGGDPTGLYIPCSNDEVSMCCAAGNGGHDQCNPGGVQGLCYNTQSNKYWRESCTDVSILPIAPQPNTHKLAANMAKPRLY